MKNTENKPLEIGDKVISEIIGAVGILSIIGGKKMVATETRNITFEIDGGWRKYIEVSDNMESVASRIDNIVDTLTENKRGRLILTICEQMKPVDDEKFKMLQRLRKAELRKMLLGLLSRLHEANN